jgi:hypothetical protein
MMKQETAPQMMPGGQPDMQQMPEGQDADLGQEVQASPEEQAQLNEFVGQAVLLIYDEKMIGKIIELLRGAGDPKDGLARATSMVVGRMIDAAEKAGDELSGDVILHGAKQVFEDLANLSGAAGIMDYSQDEDAFEGAFFRAADMLRILLQQMGKLDEAAVKQDFDKLVQMDQSGELEAMFRGLAASDDAAMQQGQPPAGGMPAGQPPMPGGGLMEAAR